MIGYCPLASSSQGNCILLSTPQSKVLIDCGISAKRVREGLQAIGVDWQDLDAVLVTHEHSDHIRGLRVLANKTGVPILANAGTAKAIVQNFGEVPKFKIFSTGESFRFGDLEVHPFSVQHDAADPVMFSIRVDGIKLGFCTDLGLVTGLVRHQLRDCDYLYLESNHEPELVAQSSRPMVYKQRVLGMHGHLSNKAAGELIRDVHHDGLKHVYLAHLSEECNRPEAAVGGVTQVLTAEGFQVDVAVASSRETSEAVLF